ncbi:hypothetical protein LguiB_012643 [Lonicera macranthoides]
MLLLLVLLEQARTYSTFQCLLQYDVSNNAICAPPSSSNFLYRGDKDQLQ